MVVSKSNQSGKRGFLDFGKESDDMDCVEFACLSKTWDDSNLVPCRPNAFFLFHLFQKT